MTRTYSLMTAAWPWPIVPAAVVAMLVNAICHDAALAQMPFQRGATKVDVDVAEAEIARQVKELSGPLDECLLVELEFVAAVCELNRQRFATLGADGLEAIERIADETAARMRKYQRLDRAQIIIRVNGAADVAPWGADPPPSDWPRSVMRSLLAEAVRTRSRQGGPLDEIGVWRSASDKLAAEERRLAELRAQAAAVVKVAALDETLRFTSDQRAQLREQFARYVSDRSSNAVVMVTAGSTEWQYTMLTGSGLAASRLPVADWRRILSASQLAVYSETLSSLGRIARRGQSTGDRPRRQRIFLQGRMEEIETVCPLREEQRAKLLLAGKLDLERLRAESSPPKTRAKGERIAARRIEVASDVPRSYPSVFDGAQSYFTKAINGRLSDDQKQKLAAARVERRSFQRRAMIEATVAGFERAAALTARQWNRLSTALNDLWAQDDEVRSEWLDDVTRMARLPDEWWRPFFLDFQWPDARQRQAQLANAIGELETRQRQTAGQRPSPAAPMIGGGMF